MKKQKNAKTKKGKTRLGHEYRNIKIEKSKPAKSAEEVLRDRNKVRLTSLGLTSVPLNSPEQISIPWPNLIFDDGYIVVEYQGKFFRKYIQQCKKYLNDIKAHYSFKKVPEIQVVIVGNQITKIINEEVLFYHIEFLTDSGTLFETSYQKVLVNKWSRYTKSYYRQHLSFYFQSQCLDKLCELSNSDLPIIPVGELVKTSSGACQIHKSFLFPISSKNGIKLVWESVEESKASYVFESVSDFYPNAQKLYDYIVGDTTNKRKNLIYSHQLRQQLKLNRRLRHTYFSEWKYEVEWLAKM